MTCQIWLLRPGMRLGFPGNIPEINVRCPEYGQFVLALFQTSMLFPGHIPDIIGPIPDITGCNLDITGPIPDITDPIPDITGPIPDIIFFLLVVFWTSLCDVRNMARLSWSYSGHQYMQCPE